MPEEEEFVYEACSSKYALITLSMLNRLVYAEYKAFEISMARNI